MANGALGRAEEPDARRIRNLLPFFWHLPGSTTVLDGWTQDQYIRFNLKMGTESYFRWYLCGDTYAGASTGT